MKSETESQSIIVADIPAVVVTPCKQEITNPALNTEDKENEVQTSEHAQQQTTLVEFGLNELNEQKEFVRSLTRQILSLSSSNQNSCNNDEQDGGQKKIQLETACGDLLALQNAVNMLRQHSILAFQEATQAVQDVNHAREQVQYWKEQNKIKDMKIKEYKNEVILLKQRNDKLTHERKVLKQAILDSNARAVLTSQVENYVVDALTCHEELMKTTTRSRTTTASTTEEEFEDLSSSTTTTAQQPQSQPLLQVQTTNNNTGSSQDGTKTTTTTSNTTTDDELIIAKAVTPVKKHQHHQHHQHALGFAATIGLGFRSIGRSKIITSLSSSTTDKFKSQTEKSEKQMEKKLEKQTEKEPDVQIEKKPEVQTEEKSDIQTECPSSTKPYEPLRIAQSFDSSSIQSKSRSTIIGLIGADALEIPATTTKDTTTDESSSTVVDEDDESNNNQNNECCDTPRCSIIPPQNVSFDDTSATVKSSLASTSPQLTPGTTESSSSRMMMIDVHCEDLQVIRSLSIPVDENTPHLDRNLYRI